jgi:hypothetical protein
MLSDILASIKKARMKKFLKNILIALPFGLSGFSALTDTESNLMIVGILSLIVSGVFLFLALRNLLAAYRCNDSTFFLRLNKLGNKKQIADFFEDQLNKTIAEDEKVIITPKLFIFKENYEQTLLNDDIVDISHLVHRTNFVIDHITITALYSDGKKYQVKYSRPLGVSDMDAKAKKTLAIANILAANCDNLRRRDFENSK